ncbi:RelA/SpoT domain-containing protein [Clostridiaceae bacterium 35-E11]
MSHGIIEKFLQQYIKELHFYQESAKLCAEICENELEQAGIRAIVTNRAKRPDRLKDKLIKRNIKKHYASMEEIYQDIIDLAGVRIALYFPGDQEEVEKFIKSNFTIIEIKKFPESITTSSLHNHSTYTKLFFGYRATHYRIHLKKSLLPDKSQKYAQAIIEIQVASVLMHAWAEVEHDLVYKPIREEISRDEYEILDELNGLVLAGEIALQRLQKAVKMRVTKHNDVFSNHYELAAFLYDKVHFDTANKQEDLIMGRTDMLFKFLKYTKLNKPEYLDPYLLSIEPYTEKIAIVQQLIHRILQKNPHLHDIYLKVVTETSQCNPYSTDTQSIKSESSS